jgi:hypothetical protein
MARKIQKSRSCGAPIFWCRTAGGRMMPVDAEATPLGSLTIETGADGSESAVTIGPEYTGERYVSHFATCPDRRKWRKS